MRRELRIDHVSELVVVRLYDGALAGTRDPDVRRFAAGHRRIELDHLRLFEAYLPLEARSRLEACRSDEARHAQDAEHLHPSAPLWARGLGVARWV